MKREEILDLYDNYEMDMEWLGTGTYEELRKIADERDKDTDGECYLIVISAETGERSLF